MTCHLVQPRDPIYVKSYGFLSFANDMDKNVGKNLTDKFHQKYLKKHKYLQKKTQQIIDHLRSI